MGLHIIVSVICRIIATTLKHHGILTSLVQSCLHSTTQDATSVHAHHLTTTYTSCDIKYTLAVLFTIFQSVAFAFQLCLERVMYVPKDKKKRKVMSLLEKVEVLGK